MRGKEVTQKEMAEFLGVGQPAVLAYRKDGCPARQSGRNWLYDTGEVVEWLKDRARKSAEAPEAAEERARLLRAQAELKEMDIAVRRGDLVEREQAEKAWADLVMAFRARILQLPPRGAELSGMRPAEAEARLKQLVQEALTELAEGKGHEPGRKRKENQKARSATA